MSEETATDAPPPAATDGAANGQQTDNVSLIDGGEDGNDDGDKSHDLSNGMPEGFPEEAWDAENNSPKADVLFKKLTEAETRAKGLRDKLAKGEGKPPKDASEYKFTPTEKGLAAFKDGNVDNDPIIAASRPIAQKYGLSKEQYAGFMSEMAEVMASTAGEGPAQMTEEQIAEYRKAEISKLGANGKQVVRAVESWARELEKSGVFSEADVESFRSLGTSADKLIVLNKLRALAGGGNSIPTNVADDGLPDDNTIRDMIANMKTEADEKKVFELLEKRRAAGRPERL